MNAQQTELYKLIRAFASRTADRIDIRGQYIDFKVGAASTFGIAGSIVIYFAAVLFLLQGYSLYFMVGMGSILTLVLMTTCSLGAILLASVSAQIDLNKRTITRYILGFKYQQFHFDQLKQFHLNQQRFLGISGGHTFLLENKANKRMSLITFRNQENKELFRELLPEIIKAF
jgi:hypothetical protein